MGTKRVDRLAAVGLPDLLTVEEAAALLRIGRTQAYELTRQWRATNGQSGLPVVELGPHTLRVPLHALEELVGARFTRPLPAAPALAVVPDLDEAGRGPGVDVRRSAPAGEPAGAVAETDSQTRAKVTPLRRPRRPAASDQPSLFDSSETS